MFLVIGGIWNQYIGKFLFQAWRTSLISPASAICEGQTFLTTAFSCHPPVFNPVSFVHSKDCSSLSYLCRSFLVFFRIRVALYICSQKLIVSDTTHIPFSEIEGNTPIINQRLLVGFHHLLLGLPHHAANTALSSLGADICFSCLILCSPFFPLSEF